MCVIEVSKGLHYDTMPVFQAEIEDLDIEKIKKFLDARIQQKKNSISLEAALDSYQLVTKVQATMYPTVAGMLLFGTNPQKFFGDAFIIGSTFAGVEGRKVLATRDFEGALFDQYEQAFNFVQSQLNRSFTIEGSKRTEEFEIPIKAVREALINALVHRNYHIRSTIKIAIYNNRIEIFSPGSFPGPLREHDLQMGLTYTRNQAISKVFREAGYSERLGSGFIAIFSSYRERGLRKPSIVEGPNFVKCILPRPSPGEDMILDKRDDFSKMLELFETATELTSTEIASLTGLSKPTVVRKLTQLIGMGYLKKIGSARTTRYVLADSTR